MRPSELVEVVDDPGPVDQRLVGLGGRSALDGRGRERLARRLAHERARSASTVTRPRYAPPAVDDDARLDVVVEQHRERVLERGPAVEQRRHRRRPGPRSRAPRAGMPSRSSTQPIGRSSLVDEQQVAGTASRGDRPRASAASSPTRAVAAGAQLAARRRGRATSRLSPRSAPTNRATKSDAGSARISSGGPNCARTPADLQDRDEVAHLDRLVDVVGHEQDRLGELLLEAQELVLEPLADDRVDRAERLVHEQHRRVRGERPRHADALALAARQLRRVAVARSVAGLEPDEREQLLGARARWRAVGQPRRRGTVATFSPIVWCGNRPDLLDHVPDAAPELDDVARRDVDAVDAGSGRTSARSAG